ncbi:MAG: InlB B-repeat-containing protein, partial [Muribaculaceae bacterium]|nr:InlB B-repeat-containing protein [Muribaculaceae bacterium]
NGTSLEKWNIADNTTVYADWTPVEYSVTYENAKGSTNSNVTKYTIESDDIILSNITTDGYTFDGWFANDSKVNSIEKGSMGNKTFTAKWTPIEYTITYENTKGSLNSNVTKYTIESEDITLSGVTANGYIFDGWFANDSKVSSIEKGSIGNKTLTAKWKPIEYTITYENTKGATNNNVTKYTIEGDDIILSRITADGYTFDGWFVNDSKVSSIEKGSIGNKTLMAKWTPIEYTITYENTKGATNNNVRKYTIESEDIALSGIITDGYTFGGWYEGSVKVSTIAIGSFGNKTLTASWTPIEYTITYTNTKGATNNNVTKYTIESEDISLSSISATGYTFNGWYVSDSKVEKIEAGSIGNKTLTASWTPVEYTITYENTKGSENENATVYTIESDNITLSALTATGYTFNGWYDGAKRVSTINKGSYGNKTLTAKWSAIEYSITYQNTKSATNSNPTKYTIESNTITLLPLSAPDTGYTFNGWYDGNTEITEIAKGSVGNRTFIADWGETDYTITYYWEEEIGGYASGTSNPATYTLSSAFELVPLINKTQGYVFEGWFTAKADGEGVKVERIASGTKGNISLYAHWSLQVYNITYHNANGIVNTNVTTYTVKSNDFEITALSKVGYDFLGWYSDSDFKTSALTTIKTGSYGNMDYYAKWNPISYSINYTLYGGEYESSGNPESYTIEDGFTLISPQLEGYVFDGWYTASTGGVRVTAITKGTTGNKSFYAHWTYISTIAFDSKGGSAVTSISAAAGTKVSAPNSPTTNYYSFAGWYSDATCKTSYSFTVMPQEDITVYAKWTPIVYSITYEMNGGTNANTNPTTYTVEDAFTFAAPTKTGHTFIAWFTDAELTSATVSEITIGSHGNIKLYAGFSINQYTLTFNSNGGTSVEPITQNYGSTVQKPSNPAKTGYTFVGWYQDSTLRNSYSFSTMPAENKTLWAKWQLVNYNITYHLDGGRNNSNNPSSYTIASNDITFAEPTKVGYSFRGWYSDSNYGTSITKISTGNYGAVEIYAKWEITTYSITYVLPNGATHTNVTSYTVETDITTLQNATLKGNTFNGWYTSASYTQKVTTIGGGSTGDLTVYGKFTPNSYTVWLDGTEEAKSIVSFNLNYQTTLSAPASQTITTSNTLTYPTKPSRSGYIFGGWYDNAECNGNPYDFTAMIVGDVTLYANWVKIGTNEKSINVGSTASVSISGTTERIYKFVPLVSGNVTITTTGSIDTYGALYLNGTQVAQNDDSGSSNNNFLIVYNVTAGKTYEIRVRSYGTASGTCTLRVTGTTAVPAGGYITANNRATVTYGQSFNLPTVTDEKYKFLGWQDENGVVYTDGTGASVRNWDKDANTVLYSKWERMIYTVTFQTNGGTNVTNTVGNTVTLEYGARFDINLYTTSRSNYTFGGWYLSASDTSAYNASTMPDENITLYAKWTTFDLGSIKESGKRAVSVNDTITPELFGAECYDTNNNKATLTVAVSGTKAAGETIIVRITATSGSKTKQLTLNDIKVYGTPTITVSDTSRTYVNISDRTNSASEDVVELNNALFSASGTDTFGEATTIRITVDGEFVAGNRVAVVIHSVDPSGNEITHRLTNIKV